MANIWAKTSTLSPCKFKFLATQTDGTTLNATVEAPDRLSAIKSIRSQGLKLVELTETSSDKKSSFSLFKLGGKVKSDELVMFTRQLSAMVSAGVPILRSLNSMAKYAETESFRKAITAVAKNIEDGESFADALEHHPAVFNDIYVNMVRAGEAAGILDDILKRLALQQEKSASIRKKVKSAMTYPMVLVFITVGSFFGLMLFVLPMIGETIKDLGGEDAELPALTQTMIGISNFMVSYWFILIPAIIGGVVLFMRWTKTPKGKKKFHYFLVKSPVLGKIIRKLAIARFTRTFSAPP